MSKRLSLFIRIAVSISLIMLLFWIMRDKFSDIISELSQTNLILFFTAFLMFCLNIVFLSLRLDWIMAGEGLKLPFRSLVELNFIGYFFNNFMPSAVGGDIVKAYYIGKHNKQKMKSYMSVFMDRYIGLLSFAAIAFIALLISWNFVKDPLIKKVVLFFFLGCLCFLFVSLNRQAEKIISKLLKKFKFFNLGEKLHKVFLVVHDYRNKMPIIYKTFLVSIVAQVVYVFIVLILFNAIHTDVGFKNVLLIMPIVSVISMLPSIGGLGLREGSIVALFGSITGNDKAFSVGILLFALLLFVSIIGGIMYFRSPLLKGLDLTDKN